MPTISGELKQLAHPTGGGFVTSRTDHTDGTLHLFIVQESHGIPADSHR
jgi:hypothetical protein